MLFVATTFYFWSVVFPRSGGVYVFLSRTIHPGLADGIILSGALSDGTSGLAMIKAHGGTTIVQDPDEAVTGGMPCLGTRPVAGRVEARHPSLRG